MKVSIIILTLNQIEYTKKCLESIRLNTVMDYELIIVDNGSSDGTVDYLKGQNEIKVIYNNQNNGYAKGNNQGFELVTGDVVIYLNNDVVVTEGWLEPLVSKLYSSDKVAFAGPVTNNISGAQRINVNYDQNTLEGLQRFSAEHTSGLRNKSKKVLRLVGFALACKKSVLNEIGGFDESFGIGNFEDDDLCLRALSKGYELFIVEDSFIHHFGSATFRGMNVDYNKIMNNNYQLLIRKWGYDVSYFMHSRREIVAMVPNSKRILEIGCGAGATGLELKNQMKCEVVGIEIDKNAYEFAKYNLDKLYLADIENFDFTELKKDKFDCIICADVLEHLRDPWSAVAKLSELLSDDGCFVASIPNVSNIEVLLGIIQGDFPYSQSGILDKTHLRFFSKRNIEGLFSPGMKIENVQATSIVGDKHKEFVTYLQRLGKRFGLDTDNLMTDAFIYQYLIRARKV